MFLRYTNVSKEAEIAQNALAEAHRILDQCQNIREDVKIETMKLEVKLDALKPRLIALEEALKKQNRQILGEAIAEFLFKEKQDDQKK